MLVPKRAATAQIERALRLSLNDLRSRQDLIDVGDIANSQTGMATGAQFAVNCEVKQGKIAVSMRVLKVDSDGPNVFGPERWLLAGQLAFVPHLTGLFGLVAHSHKKDGSFILKSRPGEDLQSFRLLPLEHSQPA